MQRKVKGFTLIELLIVLALISVLAGILIVVIRPQEIFRRARDAQRQTDLNNVMKAIDTYLADTNITPIWCSSNMISFSRSGSNAGANGWPSAPAGYTVTSTDSVALNGTGWVRLPLASSTLVNLSSLPQDPINNIAGGINYVYAFVCSNTLGQYELNGILESNPSAMQNDGGNQTGLYEIGPNKNLY